MLVELRDRYPYLRIDDENREVRYLGYVLELTRGEYGVIRALALSEKGMSKEEICLLGGGESKVKEGSVAVHICAINKKAEMLSGRKLVVYSRKSGYFINKNA